MNLKQFSTILISLTLAVIGPISPAQAKAKREVIYWGVSLSPDAKGQDAVIREFEKRNPDINVRILGMGAGQMDPTKLMTSIVGNVAPDIINQDRFTISDWASRGAFTSLTPYIERDKDDPLAPSKEKYYEGTWNEASYEGKVYAIPSAADNRILYWNRTAFKKKSKELIAAGLDPNRAPATWEETMRYNKILTEFNKDGTLKVAGFMPNFGNAWLYMFAFQNNANFLSADGRTCTMDTPEAIEALQNILDGYTILGGYENAEKFKSGFQGGENDCFLVGKVAMKIDGDWVLNGMARYAPKLDFGAAPPPVPAARLAREGRFKDEKDPYVSWVGGFSLAIPRGARNPDDGWKLIKFLTSHEGRMIEARAQAEWERRSGRVYIPRQVANIETNEWLAKEFRPAEQNYADAVNMHTKMAPVARIRPTTMVGQLLWSQHVKALETACLKKLSPQKALQQAQANVQRELDAYYGREKFPVVDMNIVVYMTAAALAVLILAIWWTIRAAKLSKIAKHETKWGYAFIAPWLIGFMILTLGPMVASFFFSFLQWDVLNEGRFVGLKNYAEIGQTDSTMVLKALSNSAYLAGIGVPFGLATGFAIAILLNAAARGMRFYRTAFYLPAIVPTIASGIIWTWVLTADPGKGLINTYWNQTLTPWLGISPPGWLSSADWAKPGLIIMGLWGAGGGMLLWLAGLKGVPSSLYEAASIDGATPWKQFWSVTFPQLSPLVFFQMVMGFIGSLQEFDRQYVMRGKDDGGVGMDDSMLTPVYHLFNNGFSYFKMGYASALAWMIFLIVMSITLIQIYFRKRWVFEEKS